MYRITDSEHGMIPERFNYEEEADLARDEMINEAFCEAMAELEETEDDINADKVFYQCAKRFTVVSELFEE